MGFGSNYSMGYYGKKIDQAVSDWLYGPYDKQKLDRFTALYQVPGVRQYFDYLLDKRADEEYLKRYQMTYNDVHDPRKLGQTQSGGQMIRSGVNFISHNVSSLYESTHPKKKKR